jgi:hypothetical protein
LRTLTACLRSGQIETALLDKDFSILLGHLAAPEWNYLGQQPKPGIEAWDLGEDSLWAKDHTTSGHIVFCTVPRADQAAGLVNRSSGKIGTQMSAVATHGEELALRVSDCVAARSAHIAGLHVNSCANLDFSTHTDLPVVRQEP